MFAFFTGTSLCNVFDEIYPVISGHVLLLMIKYFGCDFILFVCYA